MNDYRRERIMINPNRCTGCGGCVEACEVRIMKLDYKTGKIGIENPFLCIVCFRCVQVCPSDAVYVSDAYSIK